MLTGHRTSLDRSDPTFPQVSDSPTLKANKIASLQFGPCWCRGLPGEADAFDFMRLRTTSAQLPINENLFIVSARIVEGGQRSVTQVYEELADPKLVIQGGVCRTTTRFWDMLPVGWVETDDLIPVDLKIDECVSGRPESLLISVMNYTADRADLPGTPTSTQLDAR